MFLHRSPLTEPLTFLARIFLLAMPTALFLLLLVLSKTISAPLAVFYFFIVVVFNIILIIPLSKDLEKIKNYANDILAGKDSKNLKLFEKDSQKIVEAINSVHYFWLHKNKKLEAKAISDTAILDSLPDPVIIIDNTKTIIGANQAARQTWPDKLNETSVEMVVLDRNFADCLNAVISKQQSSQNLLFYADKTKKTKFYAHIKALPSTLENQNYAVIAFYDMSKTVKLEKMQSDFVANASHELRTPLAILSGFIETLQTTAKNDKKSRDMFLSVMKDQTDYMSLLIDNLLSLSNIEMKQGQKPTDVVDVQKIAENTKKNMMLKAKSKNVKLVLKKEKNLPTIVADEQQIKQLVQNLLDNAIKYTYENTTVTVEVKTVDQIPITPNLDIKQGPAVAISFNNHGDKIKPNEARRLTERFYRLQAHKNLKIKGSGLGLSIAKQIIIRHKGNLTVASNVVAGTTFCIYLPIEQ